MTLTREQYRVIARAGSVFTASAVSSAVALHFLRRNIVSEIDRELIRQAGGKRLTDADKYEDEKPALRGGLFGLNRNKAEDEAKKSRLRKGQKIAAPGEADADDVLRNLKRMNLRRGKRDELVARAVSESDAFRSLWWSAPLVFLITAASVIITDTVIYSATVKSADQVDTGELLKLSAYRGLFTGSLATLFFVVLANFVRPSKIRHTVALSVLVAAVAVGSDAFIESFLPDQVKHGSSS